MKWLGGITIETVIQLSRVRDENRPWRELLQRALAMIPAMTAIRPRPPERRCRLRLEPAS